MANIRAEEPICKKPRFDDLALESGHNTIVKANDMKSADKQRRYPPRFRLRGSGEEAEISVAAEERVPLMLTDIQGLLLHAMIGNSTIYQPLRWFVLDRVKNISHITCFVLEGVSIKHWTDNTNSFTCANKIFKNIVEVVTPNIYGGSVIEELAAVPLSDMEKESLIKKYGNINLAMDSRKDLMVMMRAVFPINKERQETSNIEYKDQYPRTQLILSAQQLVEESYPLPLKGKLQNIYSSYIMTKDHYKPVSMSSPMLALDCEMCMTQAGSELTRVSIVNENHETVYESLVKPYNEITNYLTQYSGINKTLLKDVTKRLEDVQREIRELVPPDAILVGHSLNIDLHALKMMHPYVIDTSVIYNFSGERTRKPKLKLVAKEFLNIDIQDSKHGHCSVEDALTCLKLVQLKLKKSLAFGDAVHHTKEQLDNADTVKKHIIEKPVNTDAVKKHIISNCTKEEEFASTIFNHLIVQKKKSMIVGCDDITGDYHTYLTKANECSNNQALLKKGKPKKVKLNTVDEPDDVITTVCDSVSEYDFILGHLKLEMSSDNEVSQIETIDKWFDTVYKVLGSSTLFVVIFAGTATDNGIAMFNVKTR